MKEPSIYNHKREMESLTVKTMKKLDTRKLVLLALLTALVIILQFLGAFIRFGPFSVSLVLMPIVVGAALMGALAGGWLGLVFGIVVLASGDANVFLAINPFGTITVVCLKGILAGLAAGYTYRFVSGIDKTVGAVSAAIVCPIVNTGIFVIGIYVFFMPVITQWASDAGYANTTAYIFLGMVTFNFLFEALVNLVFSPAIVRLVQYGQSKWSNASHSN